MFTKRKCKRCGRKLKSDFDFCPGCGIKLNNNAKAGGMLGKNDYVTEPEMLIGGGFTSGILNKMLSGAMKMLEKEMSKEFEKNVKKAQVQPQSQPKTKVRLMINGKEINLEGMQKQLEKQKSEEKELPINFSKEKQKEFQKLKKQEPKTNIRRIGDKLTYELEIPGIKSTNDISILKLESGLEVKAIANKKAYLKNILINMPLINYFISDGKLFLEMNANE